MSASDDPRAWRYHAGSASSWPGRCLGGAVSDEPVFVFSGLGGDLTLMMRRWWSYGSSFDTKATLKWHKGSNLAQRDERHTLEPRKHVCFWKMLLTPKDCALETISQQRHQQLTSLSGPGLIRPIMPFGVLSVKPQSPKLEDEGSAALTLVSQPQKHFHWLVQLHQCCPRILDRPLTARSPLHVISHYGLEFLYRSL